MTHPQWFMLIGGLLLVMGLSSSLLKRSPVTSAIIYLAVGVPAQAAGPSRAKVAKPKRAKPKAARAKRRSTRRSVTRTTG